MTKAGRLPLAWREARASDRRELKAFVCADPPKQLYDAYRGKYHPEPWAFEVQAHVRRLKPPIVRTDEWLDIGRDSQGVAAVVHYGQDDTDDKRYWIMTVARDERCAGLGYGRDALDHSLERIAYLQRLGGEDCAVFAKIDPGNRDSRSMFKAAGFEYIHDFKQYEVWGSVL